MGDIVMQSPQASQPKTVEITPKPKVSTPAIERIEQTIKAPQTKEIADKALNVALQSLNEMLSGRGLNVSKVLDSSGSVKQVQIADERGNKIADMPPPTAISIAEKAKQQSIGFLMDTLA